MDLITHVNEVIACGPTGMWFASTCSTSDNPLVFTDNHIREI